MKRQNSQKVCGTIISLYSLARTGWMIRGVPPQISETVAQHSFSSSLLSLILAYRIKETGIHLNPEKAALLALLHDIGESIIGDIVKDFSKKIGGLKDSIEKEVVEREIGKPLAEYVSEFIEGKSVEAKIAKIGESLATYLVAKHYSSLGYRVDDIIESMHRKIVRLLDELDIPLKLIEDLLNCS